MKSEAKSYPKRLIEVDLPIRRISEHARKEKSIRHGHISTLHIWWARRPLAACRAVMCASLWPDPADPNCPSEFVSAATKEMLAWTDYECLRILSSESQQRFNAARKTPSLLDDPIELRKALLDFIADFANWKNSTLKEFLATSRTLTAVAHEALGGITDTRPLVVDPFAGGGSIPLESLRVGADAFASDLNPIPILLNRIALEYVPTYGQALADNTRKWSHWIKDRAEQELTDVYPKDADGLTPIAYLWARTVKCEGPACGAEVPIAPSCLIEKNKGEFTWLEVKGQKGQVSISLKSGKVSKPDFAGTAKRGAVTCPCCGYTTPVASVRNQLKKTAGGIKQARLLAVALADESNGTRKYRLPCDTDYEALNKATSKLAALRKERPEAFPDETLPLMSGVFNVPLYGHTTWSSLYTNRQQLLLITLCKLTREAIKQLASEEDAGLGLATATMLSLAVGKVADYSTSICTWVQSGGFVGHTFAQGQCLPMKYDFAESTPLSGYSGSWEGAIDWGARIIERDASALLHAGRVELATATAQPLPDDSADCVFTDPPYYNAVPYADLSDFFYVWHRRILSDVHRDIFKSSTAPKAEEICEMAGWDSVRYSHKTADFFEAEITKAFRDSRRVLKPSGIGVIVFAHKTTSGWESLLKAIIDAGWVVTASWPIDTERGSRLRAMQSAALGSSVHLVCRPRENEDGSLSADLVGDWRDVLQALPRRIHEWMPRLAEEGVVGADAIFACLGPALEIFSSYARVEKANGEPVSLKEYLENVWAAVSKEALSVIFEGVSTEGFEPDARLTAMWLWTLAGGDTASEQNSLDEDGAGKSTKKGVKVGGFYLEYDAARKISQGLGARLEDLRSLVEVSGETARLLPVSQRTSYLFGKQQGEEQLKGRRSKKKDQQLDLFAELSADAATEETWTEKTVSKVGETTLDRVHQSMILFAANRGEALKRFLVEDGAGKDPKFWRLAQALSALYPSQTDEKRWVDGVLARKKGLGL